MRSAPLDTPHAQRVQANVAQTCRAHCDDAPVHHERHRPEQTTPYRLVQQRALSFITQTQEATGASLPQFVKDEFDAFVECGRAGARLPASALRRLRLLQARGVRLQAPRVLPFVQSPAQSAAHLVEHVIPRVPVRQWVLSLPIPLPLLSAAQPVLVKTVLQVVHLEITRHLPIRPASRPLRPAAAWSR